MQNLWRIVGWRIVQGAFVLVVISWLTFWLLAAAGGDAVSAMGADAKLSAATIENLRHVYALDQPPGARYARWLGGVVTGDLGFSFYYQAPVSLIILPRLARTLVLAACAFLIAWTTAITLGVLPRLFALSKSQLIFRRGFDAMMSVFIVLAASTPRLVLALVVLALMARRSAMFETADGTEAIASRLVPAAFVLALPLVALFLAQTRDGLESVLAEDYVRVARAKGLRERAVILRHVLRPMLNPLLTIGGTSLGALMSGSVIVESIFGWSGLGQLVIIAVRSRDVALLMGIVLISATCVLIGNLCADVLVRFNDPRLRHKLNATSALRPRTMKTGNDG